MEHWRALESTGSVEKRGSELCKVAQRSLRNNVQKIVHNYMHRHVRGTQERTGSAQTMHNGRIGEGAQGGAAAHRCDTGGHSEHRWHT